MKNIALLFPGQGSQTLGMGKNLFESYDIAKESFKIATESIGVDFEKLLFEDEENLQKSEFTQPAILLVSYITYKIVQEKYNIAPKFAIGHSLGEISALTCAGALELKDAISLVHNRGKLMAKACEGKNAGMMAVIGLDDATAQKCCEELRADSKHVWCANYNVDGQIVLAGNKTDLEEAIEKLKENGAKKCVLLNMSVASHCELLQDAVEEFKKLLENSIKEQFDFAIISNATTEKYSSKAEAIELLSKQLTEPVQYKQSIEKYDSEVELFIELGNGTVLKGLNKRSTKIPTISVADSEAIENLATELE